MSIREKVLLPFAGLTLCFLLTAGGILLWGRAEPGTRVIVLACGPEQPRAG
jgi:hypothetical protein